MHELCVFYMEMAHFSSVLGFFLIYSMRFPNEDNYIKYY